MCYTSNVEEKYRYWRNWSESLQRIGLQGVAASMLEASGPLNLVLAQLAYLGEPFLASGVQANLQALAALLEDGAETRSFVSFLREGMAS